MVYHGAHSIRRRHETAHVQSLREVSEPRQVQSRWQMRDEGEKVMGYGKKRKGKKK
jgi:hypothetical protein